MSAQGSTSGQEFSGRSVEDAVAEGLRRLGLSAEDATVEVINRGSRGLFGLGSEPAVVRITARTAAPAAPPAVPPAQAAGDVDDLSLENVFESVKEEIAAPPSVAHAPHFAAETPAEQPFEPDTRAVPEDDAGVAAMAAEMLGTIIRLMGFHASVTAEWRDADAITDERHLLLGARGDSLSPLIGRRGETLENLQYLLRLMVNQKLHRWLNIIVDVEEYRSKRVDHLTHLALRMADQVADTGRSFALEPMPPNERRIIHLALRDHPRVFTESTGDAERRKVNIFPRK